MNLKRTRNLVHYRILFTVRLAVFQRNVIFLNHLTRRLDYYKLRIAFQLEKSNLLSQVNK